MGEIIDICPLLVGKLVSHVSNCVSQTCLPACLLLLSFFWFPPAIHRSVAMRGARARGVHAPTTWFGARSSLWHSCCFLVGWLGFIVKRILFVLYVPFKSILQGLGCCVCCVLTRVSICSVSNYENTNSKVQLKHNMNATVRKVMIQTSRNV